MNKVTPTTLLYPKVSIQMQTQNAYIVNMPVQ